MQLNVRYYDGLTIVTSVYTACCEAYALSENGQERRKSNQIIPGEVLTCEGCGKKNVDIIEVDNAY